MWIYNFHLLFIKHTAYINFFLIFYYLHIHMCRWNIHETIISLENKGNHSAIKVIPTLWQTFTILFIPALVRATIPRNLMGTYNGVKWKCFVLCILTPDYKFFSHDHHHQHQQTFTTGENVTLKENYCELRYNDN